MNGEMDLKQRILEAVGKQINLYGVKRFTVEDVAREIGISKKTIYKYFSGKDEMVREFISMSIDDNIKSTNEAIDKEESLFGKINAALLSHHKYEIPLEFLDGVQKYYPEEWKKIEKQREYKIEVVSSLIKEGIEDGKIRKDINPDIIGLILDKMTLAIMDYSFLMKSNLNVNKALKEIEKILLDGIVAHNKDTI
jgi:AcrR family transcriptional regulator